MRGKADPEHGQCTNEVVQWPDPSEAESHPGLWGESEVAPIPGLGVAVCDCLCPRVPGRKSNMGHSGFSLVTFLGPVGWGVGTVKVQGAQAWVLLTSFDCTPVADLSGSRALGSDDLLGGTFFPKQTCLHLLVRELCH